MPRMIYDGGTGHACTLAGLLNRIASIARHHTCNQELNLCLPTEGNLEPLAARIILDCRYVDVVMREHRGPVDNNNGYDGPDVAPRLIDGIDALYDYVRELRRIVKSEAPSFNDAMQAIWRGDAILDDKGNVFSKERSA
jgi:hypothetical protein